MAAAAPGELALSLDSRNGGRNMTKLIASAAFSFLLLGAPGWNAMAQNSSTTQAQEPSAKKDAKDAGHELKEGAKATGRAAKKTGSATKKVTKKAVNKSAEGVGKAADKVQEKTD